jgi:hypothetical protein
VRADAALRFGAWAQESPLSWLLGALQRTLESGQALLGQPSESTFFFSEPSLFLSAPRLFFSQPCLFFAQPCLFFEGGRQRHLRPRSRVDACLDLRHLALETFDQISALEQQRVAQIETQVLVFNRQLEAENLTLIAALLRDDGDVLSGSRDGQPEAKQSLGAAVVDEVLRDAEAGVASDVDLGVLLAVATDVHLKDDVQPLAFGADHVLVALVRVDVEHRQQVWCETPLCGVVDGQLGGQVHTSLEPTEMTPEGVERANLRLKVAVTFWGRHLGVGDFTWKCGDDGGALGTGERSPFPLTGSAWGRQRRGTGCSCHARVSVMAT